MISHLTRASVRRLVALTPTGARSPLRSTLVHPELAGPLPLEELEIAMASYVLDPCGRPIVDEDRRWLARSQLVRMTGPTCGVPIGDDVAAIIAAPRLVVDDRLSDVLQRMRFASRADDAMAAAVAQLSPDGAVAAIQALAANPGPEEEHLHLALLQAGAALAWRPELAERLGEVVDALLALLDRTSPQPLLHAVAGCLGPVAATSVRVRDAVIERARAARQRIEGRRTASSFLAELALEHLHAQRDEPIAAEALRRTAEDLGSRRRDLAIGERHEVILVGNLSRPIEGVELGEERAGRTPAFDSLA